MIITLKLFATFRRYLPDGCQGHSCNLEVTRGASVGDVLARFGVPPDGTVVLVNGRTATPDRVLEEEDVVAAFPALAGG